ncbi:hypothetical protein RvY_05116 [Ramazzottius varieornatus]|uniref:Armadillo repeat-containing domain-containing protein n=1 Tax=Ramazzottius varieornatus TaxID=947166 RepID=A0A1D1UX11_RAMVA|nr:hypothetical protein RvY_05116 [Ramazzottius varieornatus]
MAHHSLFPVRDDHGLNRAIVNTAALAGAAYMGFRLIKLVNYWNKGEVSDIGVSDAVTLSNALLGTNAVIDANGFEALDLPFVQQYSTWMTSSAMASPNPTFKRRLHQLSKGKGSSLPATPRASLFFPMNMPLDVGINSFLCGLASPDESKAVLRVNTLKFDKQLQAFGLDVMKHQTEQSLKVVSELDAKCLVKLVSTDYAHQDEELFMKLITAIANCSTFTHNQDSLREAGCLETLRDLIQSSAPERIRSLVAQAMSNLAVNEANQQFLKLCVPDLLHTLRTAQFEGLQLNCLNALINLSVLPGNHEYFSEDGIEFLLSRFDVTAQATDNEKLQALKVLVNLSCNEAEIPLMLNAKVPDNFFGIYIDPSVAEHVLLRFAVLLRNLTRFITTAGNTATSSCPEGSMGSFLSAREVLKELHTRSVFIGNTAATQELRSLAIEIANFTASCV